MSSSSKGFLHLFILSSFAVAQPLFSLLAGEPAFFVIRRSDPVDILALAFGLMLFVPLPMLLIEAIAGLFGAKTRRAIHLFFVGMLVSVILLPHIKRLAWPGPVAVAGALLFGALAVAIYARKELFREYLSYLAPVLVIFPLMFLGSSSIRGLLFPPEVELTATSTQELKGSLVMVVFDELPSTALLDEQHRIDSTRYPNLAALAAVSTWYPNAMASSDATSYSLPALLTGQHPQRVHPTASNYPQNLFTLLGGSVELTVSESTAQLCPPSLCASTRGSFRDRMRSLVEDLGIIYSHVVLPEDLTVGLPPITDNWMNFGDLVAPLPWKKHRKLNRAQGVDRSLRFKKFLDAFDSDSKPGLYFSHTLLPHMPHNYLPSGRRHNNLRRPRGLAKGRGSRWSTDQERVDRDYQLFLLQVGYVDTLVGELVERLKHYDLFGSSLLVVTADHGVSYLAGQPRRLLVQANAPEILPVPLLIKAPYQSQSIVDRRTIQSIDVLPTIADLFNLQIPWEMDGISAGDPAWPRERSIRAMSTMHGRWSEIKLEPEDLESRHDLLARRLDLFGNGYGEQFWAFGPYRDLIGSRPEQYEITTDSSLGVTVNSPVEALNLVAGACFVPAFLEGNLRWNGLSDKTSYMAIGINGVIQAVVPVDRASGRSDERKWSAAVPEQSFQVGENRVRVFLLRELETQTQLIEAKIHFEPS